MSISDLIAKFLVFNKIDTAFIYPGGTIAPLINSFIKYKIKIEVFKSEQGAGYAALANSMATGVPQLLLVTSGPGFTNVISCICDAFFDSIPLFIISGQVGTGDLLSNRKVRQLGFQQVDGANMMRGVTKYSSCFESEFNFEVLDNVLDLTTDGRMGPVYLELPMDIQRKAYYRFENVGTATPPKLLSKGISKPTKSQVEKFTELFNASKKPLVLVGGGAISDVKTYQSLNAFVRKTNLPFVSSFRGIGVTTYEDPLNLGYLGHTGHEQANRAAFEADFILVLGSRLDVRQTGTEVDDFSSGKCIFSVNNDESELEYSRVKLDYEICTEVYDFLQKLSEVNSSLFKKPNDDWMRQLAKLKREARNDISKNGKVFAARILVSTVSQIVTGSVGVVTGVGSHQHWVARHFDFCIPKRRLFSSSGHGTMGYDVPSAVGVAMSNEFDITICFVGDGSIMHNICELRSAVDRDLNIAFIVFRNRRLGIVSQFQKITFGADPTTSHFQTGDLCQVASGFGLSAINVNFDDEEALREFLVSSKSPRLAVVDIPEEEDVSPMLLGGSKLNELWTL